MTVDQRMRVGFISASVAARVRILLPHLEEWHVALWFRMGRDGSVYFGPPYAPTGELSQQKISNVGRTYHIDRASMVEVPEPKLVKHSRTSIHPSGAINLAGERFHRENFSHLSQQEHLCGILFERPERYPKFVVRPARTIDARCSYPVDVARPLVGELYVAPRGKERYVRSEKAPYQANLVVQFAGFDDGMDRSIQFLLCHLNQSAWPDATWFMIPAGNRTLASRLRRLVARLTTR
jgi:hypothetical protein